MSAKMGCPAVDEVEQVSATEVLWGGKLHTYFGGCDYLRMAWHPRIRRAIAMAYQSGVSNVSASRCTTGNHPLYAKVEEALRSFFEVPDAVLVGNGYAANLAIGQAFRGEFDRILIDERAHPSLRDAAALLGVGAEDFAHRSVVDLEKKLRRKTGRVLVATDAVFAQDGALAPLREYFSVIPETTMLLVDDAHGAGVLGEGGRGSANACGICGERLIQTITLSKAFGVSGGTVLGSRRLLKRIRDRAGSYVASTPLAPPMAAGALASVTAMGRGATRLKKLRRNMDFLCAQLEVSPLEFPVLAAVSRKSKPVVEGLRRGGIHPPFIRYPGGAAEGFFRFSISSEHTRDQLQRLAHQLRPHLSDGHLSRGLLCD